MKNQFDTETLRRVPVLDVLRELAPDSHASRKGVSLRCPNKEAHANGDKNPSAWLGRHNRIHCAVCELGHKGKDPIGLTMLLQQCDFREACQFLEERFGQGSADPIQLSPGKVTTPSSVSDHSDIATSTFRKELEAFKETADDLEERASILEFEAGYSREISELLALQQLEQN